MKPAITVCPGCELIVPVTGFALDRPMNASPECWEIYGEVLGYELMTAGLGKFHQLAVDACGAQHAREGDSSIRLAFPLVGLHLALERKATGLAVRDAHMAMGRQRSHWPEFRRPVMSGLPTVLDLACAGARVGSPTGHAAAVQRWAAAVWRAWTDQHADVAVLARRAIPPRLLSSLGNKSTLGS